MAGEVLDQWRVAGATPVPVTVVSVVRGRSCVKHQPHINTTNLILSTFKRGTDIKFGETPNIWTLHKNSILSRIRYGVCAYIF